MLSPPEYHSSAGSRWKPRDRVMVAPWWHEHDLPAADAAGAGREVCEGCQAASQSAEEGEKGGECTMGIRAYGQE
eukprot:scaffold50081_cov23-Tisochrysis_lutea.AAC.1